MQKKLSEFDWIRFLAIIIILFHHLPSYTFNYYDLSHFGIALDLSVLNEMNRYTGLGLFIFASGYLLNLKRTHTYDAVAIKEFAIKRWLRIFPLYIIAFGTFIYMYKITQSVTVLAHLCGLQLMLASPSLKPSPTLWFIGLITVYYAMFLIWKAKNLRQAVKFCAIAGFPIVVLVMNSFWGFTDFRLFLYYGVFWFGIYCGTSRKLDIWGTKLVLTASCLTLLITPYLWQNGKDVLKTPQTMPQSFLLINALMFCFIIFCYYIFRKAPTRGYIFRLVENIAYASYCIYLFHRPFLFAFERILEKIVPFDDIYVLSALVIGIGLPLLFLGCYFVQKLYDRQFMPLAASYCFKALS